MNSMTAQTDKGHETTDAAVKPVLVFLIGLAVLIVVVMILMAVFFGFMESRFARTEVEESPLVDRTQVPPGPRLQANPTQEMFDFRSREEDLLSSYGWIDETTGVFRIPIERAKEIIADNGLPYRSEKGRVSTD